MLEEVRNGQTKEQLSASSFTDDQIPFALAFMRYGSIRFAVALRQHLNSFPESTKGWQPESCQPTYKSRIT